MWSLYDLEKLHNQNLIKFLFKINSTICSLKKTIYSKFKFYDPHTILYSFGNHIHYLLFFFFFFLYILLYNKWGGNSNSDTSYRKNLINTEYHHFGKKKKIKTYITLRAFFLTRLILTIQWEDNRRFYCFWSYTSKLNYVKLSYHVTLLHGQLNYVQLYSQVNLISMRLVLT